MSRNKREGWYRGCLKGKFHRGAMLGEIHPALALRSSRGNMRWFPKPGMSFGKASRRFFRPKSPDPDLQPVSQEMMRTIAGYVTATLAKDPWRFVFDGESINTAPTGENKERYE